MPKTRIRFRVFCRFALAFPLAVTGMRAGSPLLPLTDNTASPHSAVYCWGISGYKKGLYEAYASWLNRPALWVEDFQATDKWDNINGSGGWQLGPWSEWAKANASRRLILSVALLPGPWNGSGPGDGIDAKIPVSLEEGARGSYNKHFQKLAENLVAKGLGGSILRLGWEFNGGWYAWRAVKKEEAFAEYWRQIVKTMRSVPGAETLQFCWNPTNNMVQIDARTCWPGDAYVDYIGVDVYDQSWLPDTYPLPKGAADEEILRRQKNAWNGWIWSKQQHGLELWRDFAKEQGKPLAIPEWGTCNRKDGHGGMDNPYFIQKMYEFIAAPENNVAFHCYFDVEAGDGHHQLSPGLGNHQSEFPKSAEKFKTLFALP